jgi:PhnB protein
MAQLNPYLTFNGNCETAFKFYRSVFGGEFQQLMRFKDMPPMPDMKLPESAKEKLMHIALPISKETILMGSDANPAMGEVKTGQNLSLAITASSKEEADKIFKRLSEGGKVTMPLADQFWNSYFGMLTDLFNINWMISYEYPKKD